MFCSVCGREISEGAKFCASCGTPVAAKSDEPAVSAAQQPAHEQEAPQAAATPQPPVSSEQNDEVASKQDVSSAQQTQASAQQNVSSGQGQSYQQQGSYNSQASYQQAGAYQQQQQQQQQQAIYQQPQTKQKVYANTTGNSRALAMCAYWGLFPLIFCAVVGDKDTDPFIRHHLNQALVIFIGSIIAALTAFIIIGGILAIYLLVMLIMGTVHASHGEMTELPLIGKIKIYK